MKVLLAVDLKKDAAEVVAHAAPWVARLGAVADVLYADEYAGMWQSYASEDVQTLLRDIASEDDALGATLLAALPPQHRGRWIRVLGPAHRLIGEHASDYAMVIVGTQSRGAIAQMWLGSVAERVVRSCPRSVLVVRGGEPPAQLRRVLVGIDLREPAEPLIDAIVPLAEGLGAPIDLLYADEWAAADLTTSDHGERERRRRVDALEALRNRLPEAQRGTVAVTAARAARALVDGASGHDLVVVGTHGRVGLAHFGSVAERVVRLAPCPVLVLRPWHVAC